MRDTEYRDNTCYMGGKIGTNMARQTRKTVPRQKTASENVVRLEHDYHFKSTSDPRFHADHLNLCIRAVQITKGELSEGF